MHEEAALLSKATRLLRMGDTSRYGQADFNKLAYKFSIDSPSSRVGMTDLENKLALANGRKAASTDDVINDSNKRFFGMDDSGEQARLKEASELADQYTREARGNKNRAPRGRIKMKTPEGYAKGGKVRGTGCATKGHGKGTMR